MTEYAFNVIYFLLAICVTYKLAYIITRLADRKDWPANGLRCSALVYGVVILGRATARFAIHDPASILDLIREFCLCLFLIAAINAFRHLIRAK